MVDQAVSRLASLTSDELVDMGRVADVLALPASLSDVHSGVEPRGYRLLHRLPRLSDTIIERIVERFVNLQQIMRASLGELEQVEGVGVAKARSVKEGLARLAESSIFERYQ
jgi:diadenylate cyclase